LEGHGGHSHLLPRDPQQSGDVIFPATTNAVGLVEEVFAIAERLLGVLIDCHRDGLDVLVTPPLANRIGQEIEGNKPVGMIHGNA
jgi:hypothetical protein